MKKNIISSVAIYFIGMVTFLSAQIAPKISLQGVLREASGIAVEDGQYDLTFKLYEGATGGMYVFTEDHLGVNIVNGVYSVQLGSVDPSNTLNSIPFDVIYFVGVTAFGQELTPRMELTYSPYTLAAQSVTCSGAVGDIKYSILKDADFQAVNGDCWVEMNGQSLSFTVLGDLTGLSHAPDMSGLFIRAHEWNDGNDPGRSPGSTVASLQSDEVKEHDHSFSGTTVDDTHEHTYRDHYTYENSTSGIQPDFTHTYPNDYDAANDDDDGKRGYRDDNTSSDTHSHTFSGTTGMRGSDESRPKNMNFYVYIRVN